MSGGGWWVRKWRGWRGHLLRETRGAPHMLCVLESFYMLTPLHKKGDSQREGQNRFANPPNPQNETPVSKSG